CDSCLWHGPVGNDARLQRILHTATELIRATDDDVPREGVRGEDLHVWTERKSLIAELLLGIVDRAGVECTRQGRYAPVRRFQRRVARIVVTRDCTDTALHERAVAQSCIHADVDSVEDVRYSAKVAGERADVLNRERIGRGLDVVKSADLIPATARQVRIDRCG